LSAKSRSKTAFAAKKGDLLLHSTRRPKRRFCDRQKPKPSWDGQDLERTRGPSVAKVVSKAELDAAESKFNRLNGVADQMRSNIRRKKDDYRPV